jgi:hypothetical protein
MALRAGAQRARGRMSCEESPAVDSPSIVEAKHKVMDGDNRVIQEKPGIGWFRGSKIRPPRHALFG